MSLKRRKLYLAQKLRSCSPVDDCEVDHKFAPEISALVGDMGAAFVVGNLCLRGRGPVHRKTYVYVALEAQY